ncbi:hypothetical protein [Campylobacter sp. MG1]|uniref:hypothetical protein n=1 Tax=Campylobacter sp. MG1 TaxID=2976332 RepID=UPI00226D01DC|nr:hypothetical protein [Campylobacter sp. MG1]
MKDDKRTSYLEKEELLNNYIDYSIWNFNKKIVLKFIVISICSIILISLRLHIYESSKFYIDLRDKREVLIEENKELKRKIEALQFKNKITNYFEVRYK